MPIARLRRFAAAAALALVAAPASPAELGALFHTPEERARLDRLRRGDPEIAVSAGGRSAAPSVTGFVRRSDGRHTVWIDGSAVTVRRPGAEKLLDPSAVGAHPDDADVKFERKTPR